MHLVWEKNPKTTKKYTTERSIPKKLKQLCQEFLSKIAIITFIPHEKLHVIFLNIRALISIKEWSWKYPFLQIWNLEKLQVIRKNWMKIFHWLGRYSAFLFLEICIADVYLLKQNFPFFWCHRRDWKCNRVWFNFLKVSSEIF